VLLIVRCDTTVELVKAFNVALETIAVPLAPGAGNTPAKGTVDADKSVDALVTITFETL
jgi:hypothetical protein